MDFVAFTTLLGLLSISILAPGPNGLLVLQTRLESGKRAARAAIVGLLFGALIWVSLAMLGITLLLVNSPQAFALLKVAGAGWMIYRGVGLLLGSQVMGATRSAHGLTKSHLPRHSTHWLCGLSTALLNPGTALLFAAVVPHYMANGQPSILIGLLYLVLALLWYVALVLLCAQAGAQFCTGLLARWLTRVLGTSFVSFGVLVGVGF